MEVKGLKWFFLFIPSGFLLPVSVGRGKGKGGEGKDGGRVRATRLTSEKAEFFQPATIWKEPAPA